MLYDVVLVWLRSHKIVRLERNALGPLVDYQGPGAHKHPHVALKMLRAFGQFVQHMSQYLATML